MSKHPSLTSFSAVIFLALFALLGSSISIRVSATATALRSTASTTPMPTSADRWFSLYLSTPYPWTTPLPKPSATLLDGVYAKIDPSEPQWWSCRRCPDFLPAGGAWRLGLDKGIYRIYYQVTGWRSLGSFALSGERIFFFNDPNCSGETGVYKWRLKDGELTLDLIEDRCAIGLRAANLTRQPWLSCRPPNPEAAISDHWLKPEGCVK